MGAIARLWAGRIYGTNTGNLFLEVDIEGEQVRGSLRVMDQQFGLTVWDVVGTFADQTLRLAGKPKQAPDGIQIGDIEATGQLTPGGSLKGEWKSAVGTAGTFEAYPHTGATAGTVAAKADGAPEIPEQVFTSTITLGALRLYRADLEQFVNLVRRDFLVGRPVVTYRVRGNEATRYFEDFLKEADSLGDLKALKLNIQELEAHGINRVVTFECSPEAGNQIRVQGVNESWVMGKAESLARTLKTSEKIFVTTYKKFGLTLNQLIFIAMVVVIPAIDVLIFRAAFAGTVVVLLMFLVWLHSKVIPNFVLYLSKREPSLLQRWWPSVLSWLVAVTSTLAASYLFYLFTGSAGG